ncbi:membrane metalloprotease [Winogradskyella ouciana]|uniref:Membrane metalloprotease n=1 Tax=Winogradskyella ouciana TaxID=2608631 RepID=A0A7K1GFE7_9FLAO|nr:membrane metalloprotease [Winogradskyella ouciana]MTE27843.1 membrane metalloprotease [Winogradskyella ouciana]
MKFRILYTVLLLLVIVGCSKDDSVSGNDEGNNPVDVNLNRQAVGSSANDLLSDNTFNEMIIELVYVEGYEPNETTVSNFMNFLQNRVNKPNGITVEKRSIPSPGETIYSIQDIANIEIAERQNYNTEDTIAVWALFIHGESENNTNNNVTLGSAYWNTSFVIFEETVQNFSNSTFEPNRTLLETTVIHHEFGHIFGLTNLGSDMVEDHEDDEHPKHCDVEDCLMFWATESSAGLDDMLNMNSAPELDSQCIADLQANGGK